MLPVHRCYVNMDKDHDKSFRFSMNHRYTSPTSHCGLKPTIAGLFGLPFDAVNSFCCVVCSDPDVVRVFHNEPRHPLLLMLDLGNRFQVIRWTKLSEVCLLLLFCLTPCVCFLQMKWFYEQRDFLNRIVDLL